ncbi:PREDICTED: elongation of very long chain fatty acids protein 1 [Bactrocera latifrons]|uniref:Elongation of very long chain fatty acids protein n=1 Tax=Bactrocera latifrons TaxID=174628 RepID=A0A0K8W144_BACLA|nr:PREDICTED: elongation of very long chain fatty acids protein 1 [Bactrocera latifrons]
MAYIIKYIYRLLHDVFEQHKDPRVQHLPLVGSPLPVAVCLVAYLSFVLHYGPKWMENRKPFNLKYIMRVYNAIQVLANLIIFFVGVPHSYMRKEFSLTCQPIDHTNTEPWMWIVIYLTYLYYITKYLDLLDTIFFVLRKKNNQITFLHVYHHAGMVFAVYAFTTFLTGSHSTMIGVINALIHTVMYGYYFVTSVWTVKRALWWKRHITQLQLLQFGYLFIHFLMAIVRNHCQHPLIISFVGLIQNLFMFALFADFYYKEYIRKPKLLSREQQRQRQQQQQQKQLQNLQVTSQQQGDVATQRKQSVSMQTPLTSVESDLCEQRLQQTCVTQMSEQLNSSSNAASGKQLPAVPASTLFKAKYS